VDAVGQAGAPGTLVQGAPSRAPVRWMRWSQRFTGAAFVAPTVLVLGLVVVFPVADALWLSVTRPQGRRQVFAGLANYARLLHDHDVWSAFSNSVSFTAGSVLGHLALGLATALLLNQAIPFRQVFRVITLVPWMFAGVVVAMTWRWMLDP